MSKPNFIQQLMQRRVMRALSLYLVCTFVILQVADITFEPLGLPTWVMQGLIAALVAGLPITAVLAWIFDITQGGIVRTDDSAIEQAASVPAFSMARKIEVAIIALLSVGLAWLIYLQFAEQAEQTALASGTPLNRSVAVLPFANYGGEDHLALGLTNELTSALSTIPDLHVASYSFAALTELPSDNAKAEALNVRHLVKGSVQQSGDRLRVTAQVIRAKDGKVIWSLKRDQGMDDIFALQDEIATNVAVNLQSTLYTEALAAGAATRTDNLQAYNAYLRALRQEAREWPLVIEYLQQAIALDPQFVPALTLLAQAYLTRVGGTIPFNEAYPLAEKFAQQALALAPDYPPALIVQAHLQRMARNYDAAETLFRRAKQLAPNRPTLDLANFLRLRGDLDGALKEYEHSININPLNLGFYGQALFAAGQYDHLFETHEPFSMKGPTRWQALVSGNLAAWHTYAGNAQQANQWLDQTLALVDQSVSTATIGLLVNLLAQRGRDAEATELLDKLEALQARQYVSPAGLFWAYYGLGDLERAFLMLNRAVDENVLILLIELKTSPLLDPLRKDLRFISVLDRLGLNETER
jgi:TolB-like protein/Tfp pilus assembly protein PilF